MVWYKLKASGLQYTVVKKEYLENSYVCIIRFRNTVKPHPDWVKLGDLRASAERVLEEEDKNKKPGFSGLLGWFSI